MTRLTSRLEQPRKESVSTIKGSPSITEHKEKRLEKKTRSSGSCGTVIKHLKYKELELKKEVKKWGRKDI